MGVDMYPSLMGTFNSFAPILAIDPTFDGALLSLSLVPFRTSYLSDNWTLPSVVKLGEGHSFVEMAMFSSIEKVIYQASYEIVLDPDLSSLGIEEGYPMLPPNFVVHSTCSHDFLNDNFPPDEEIFDTMSCPEMPWEDLYYRPSSLQYLERTEHNESWLAFSE